jgi:hypothetical protein
MEWGYISFCVVVLSKPNVFVEIYHNPNPERQGTTSTTTYVDKRNAVGKEGKERKGREERKKD